MNSVNRMVKRMEHIGDQTLILGDCREVMPTLGRFDSVVTDPPYDFDTSGGGIFRRGRDCMDRIAKLGIDKGFDHTFMTQALCNSVICFCHNDQLVKLLPWFEEHFERHVVCSWHKENPMPVANKHYKPDTEFYIHAWSDGGFPVGNLEDKGRWFLAPVGKSDCDHPTVKPINLMRKIIRNVNGDTILDPFMGSGTTLVACQQLGRKGTGIEISEKYFDIACKRVEQAAAQPSLFAEPQQKSKQEAML